MQTSFELTTSGPGLYEFSGAATDWLAGQGDGLLTLFVRHSSCSLLVQENADSDCSAISRRFLPAWCRPSTTPRCAI